VEWFEFGGEGWRGKVGLRSFPKGTLCIAGQLGVFGHDLSLERV
jgi:hypothetical protein